MVTHEDAIDVRELRDLIGHDAVLIPLPLGSKASKKKWGHLTIEAMSDQRYVERLASGNVAVVLGDVSNGLCAVDIDVDHLVQPFIDANEHLHLDRTLRSRGARGAVFWIKCVGEYLENTTKLKTVAGAEAGEFRSNGHYSVIAGVHPEGHRYQILVARRPLVIEFSDIRWPAELRVPSQKQHTHHTTSLSSLSSPVSSVSSVSQLKSLITHREKNVIEQCVATEAHQNHLLLLKLARGVKSLEKQSGTAMRAARIKAMFDEWYRLSAPFLRADQSKDRYYLEFVQALERARYPLGEGVLDRALERARNSEPPPEVMVAFEDPNIHLLATLCRELQKEVGDRPFYMSARTAQRLFQFEHPMDAWRLLKGFCYLKILKLERRGRPGVKGLANEFRYIAEEKDNP